MPIVETNPTKKILSGFQTTKKSNLSEENKGSSIQRCLCSAGSGSCRCFNRQVRSIHPICHTDGCIKLREQGDIPFVVPLYNLKQNTWLDWEYRIFCWRECKLHTTIFYSTWFILWSSWNILGYLQNQKRDRTQDIWRTWKFEMKSFLVAQGASPSWVVLIYFCLYFSYLFISFVNYVQLKYF